MNTPENYREKFFKAFEAKNKETLESLESELDKAVTEGVPFVSMSANKPGEDFPRSMLVYLKHKGFNVSLHQQESSIKGGEPTAVAVISIL